MRSSPEKTSTESDSELIDRYARGDKFSLEILFERHRDVAYRVAYRLLGNTEDALDAVQNGFIKVLNRLKDFERRSSFKTWLLKIISNAAIDLGRQRSRREEIGEEFFQRIQHQSDREERHDPIRDAEQNDLREALDRALDKLTKVQKQAFVLHVDGGLTYLEIAEVMETSAGTVMSRLYYARQRLKGLLASHTVS